eukprot:CAMPEP_0172313576 /NCGR_PEP_ID=MMETSP1058-20130122/20500_1 /TAXON_ID=83371 /ORGANISM="Detonula confervacea, Strain CCMP 353" /LENGTH=415 /DNA_ID=CAMNT_0013027251 /DNA_START=335 /DNA_END=1579 /DNA_ORIENTATION=+
MPSGPNIEEYIMWSKEEAYMRDCELHYKGNKTWGKLHAPYVDKIEAKNIVERMNVPALKIIPTLAVLDKHNMTKYTLKFMKSLKQPYIIKSSHQSGGVARVHNNKYHCFKYCANDTVLPLGQVALRQSKFQFTSDLNDDYSKMGGEMQYRYIKPAIIIEEDVISGGKTNTDVTFWWISNGHPVFVSEQCEQPVGNQQGFQMKRIFVGTDYRRLPIVFNRDVCEDAPKKPKSWNTQLEIIKEVGKSFPNEVVRVDVYGGGDEVWFSELTFTTAGCWRRFTPALTDGLLYGLMKNRISPDIATPENVERMLTDKSWVFGALDGKKHLATTMHGAYPSPVDLCLRFEEFSEKGKMKKKLFDSCIQEAKSVQNFSLRCIVSEKNGTKIHSFGVNDAKKGDSNMGLCAEKALKLLGGGLS